MKIKTPLMIMLSVLSISGCTSTQCQSTMTVEEFIHTLEKMERSDGGEFPTDEAAMGLASELPLMLSITQSNMDALAVQDGLDPKDCDIYPLFALSAVLYEHTECRDYVRNHFDAIQHPDVKFTWAYLFLLHNQQTPNMTKYVRSVFDAGTSSVVSHK
ncbi:MAG: hypothetical protein V1929_06925 [bacterium]